MATNSEIVDFETKVIEAKALMVRIKQKAQDAKAFPVKTRENSDFWGTLGVNLTMLATEARLAAEEIEQLRDGVV